MWPKCAIFFFFLYFNEKIAHFGKHVLCLKINIDKLSELIFSVIQYSHRLSQQLIVSILSQEQNFIGVVLFTFAVMPYIVTLVIFRPILLFMYCHITILILIIKFYKCYCYNSNHTIFKLVKVAMEMMPLFESYVFTGTLHYRCSGILHTNKQPHNHAIRMLLNISSNNMYLYFGSGQLFDPYLNPYN